MAAAGGITLGTFGYFKIASSVLLVRPGASLMMPENPDIPVPINGYGGYGAMNWETGFKFPQINAPVIPVDTGAPNWFTAANMNAWFITRSARPIWDLAATTATFSDNGSVLNSEGIFDIAGVKGAGFTLSIRKGQGISLMTRWAGTTATPETTAGDRPTTGFTGKPLSFARAALGTELDGKGITGLTLEFDTGLTPNMELNGLYTPVEQNGGTPSCTLSLEVNALDNVAPIGWDVATAKVVEVNDYDFSILYDETTPTSITFNLERLLLRDPRNRQTQPGRVGRTFTYDCLANADGQPLLIS